VVGFGVVGFGVVGSRPLQEAGASSWKLLR